MGETGNGGKKARGAALARLARRFGSVDANVVEVLRGAGLAMFVRALGAACAFALNVVIGRLLGAEGAGYYFLSLAIVTVCAIVARMGMDNVLLRVTAHENATENWSRLRGGFVRGVALVGAVSLAASLVLMIVADQIAVALFDDPALGPVLRWMSLSIFTFALMPVIAESLKGVGRIGDSMLVAGAIYPVVALALIWPMAALLGASGAGVAYTLGTGAAALYGYLMWRRVLPSDTPREPYPLAELWLSARPLWLMSILNGAVLPWAPLFMLGIWYPAEEAGIYGAATRIVMLLGFFLMAANTALASKFSRLFTEGDMVAVNRLVRRFTLIVTLAASPVFLVLVFGGDLLMGLFGPAFTEGAAALVILTLGQATRLLTGSAGFILILTGHEAAVRNSSLLGVVVVFVSAVLLIPGFGMVGAALASALAVASISVFDAIQTYRRIGVVMLPG